MLVQHCFKHVFVGMKRECLTGHLHVGHMPNVFFFFFLFVQTCILATHNELHESPGFKHFESKTFLNEPYSQTERLVS